MNYAQAVEFVLDEEGGIAYNVKDRGGLTNFGISQRQYPYLDIPNLTKEQAAKIYKHDYWDKIPDLPARLKFLVFDFAVNAGTSRAIKTLQLAVSVNADGDIGPKTRAAIKQVGDDAVLVLFSAERARFYAGLDNFSSFGRGWMRRTMRAFYHAIQN